MKLTLHRQERAANVARHDVCVFLGLHDRGVPACITHLLEPRAPAQHPHCEIVSQLVEMKVLEARNRAGRRPTVLCNPGLPTESRLSQVFLNLFINAARAVGEGRDTENRTVVSTRIEGARVIAEVRDTGCGMTKDAN